MKKVLILLLSVAAFVGCSDVEGVTYNAGSTFLAFDQSSYNLPVNVNSSSTINIKFVSSSISSVARTYNLSVVSEESNANPLTYNLPATVTIPANEYEGTLTITGTDNNLLDATIKKIVFKIEGLSASESTDTEEVTVNIYEVCPLDLATFEGDFDAATYWLGASTHYVAAGATPNTLQIEGFWEDNATAPNFIVSYDADNVVTFLDQNTGYYSTANGGFIWARMSTVAANVSVINPCNNTISIWVNYYIPGVGSFGDKLEVFTKQ